MGIFCQLPQVPDHSGLALEIEKTLYLSCRRWDTFALLKGTDKFEDSRLTIRQHVFN